MHKGTWKIYAVWIVLVEAVGAFSGWLTREGTELYRTAMEKPPLSPPGIVFPIVWSLLFALMGIGAARIYLAARGTARTRALQVFGVQLGFNFLWSILFFNLQAYLLAFLWLVALWGLIAWMISAFHQVDRPAARIQLPYLLWVTFAGYLNLGVWLLNR